MKVATPSAASPAKEEEWAKKVRNRALSIHVSRGVRERR
jgi:hypothetical protein